ncbi:MAG TPA: hypothetical protein VIR58_15770 [Acidimicrobiales bacterium]
MDLRPTSGRELRYTLTIVLADVRRTLTVPELLDALNRLGMTAAGRPAKTISDALRWEVRKGRVVQPARGRYRTGRIPRSTLWWTRQQAFAATHERESAVR